MLMSARKCFEQSVVGAEYAPRSAGACFLPPIECGDRITQRKSSNFDVSQRKYSRRWYKPRPMLPFVKWGQSLADELETTIFRAVNGCRYHAQEDTSIIGVGYHPDS